MIITQTGMFTFIRKPAFITGTTADIGVQANGCHHDITCGKRNANTSGSTAGNRGGSARRNAPNSNIAAAESLAIAGIATEPGIFTSYLNKKSRRRKLLRLFNERLAATYSRRTYRTTTIGPAVFDGRVRNGNGSDHCGIATKNLLNELNR